jgi:hypothetical protein
VVPPAWDPHNEYDGRGSPSAQAIAKSAARETSLIRWCPSVIRRAGECMATASLRWCPDYSCTITGSPMLTVLKYHSASAGLRLMHP